MNDKKEKLNAIIADVFRLDSPPIDLSRKDQITDFITTAVNGDYPIDHLTLNAMLNANVKGVILYILTNFRLIKIDIGETQILSSSFHLNSIIGAERKYLDVDHVQFSISFQNGSFGLKYSPADKKITDFFQKIDQVSTEMRGRQSGDQRGPLNG